MSLFGMELNFGYIALQRICISLDIVVGARFWGQFGRILSFKGLGERATVTELWGMYCSSLIQRMRKRFWMRGARAKRSFPHWIWCSSSISAWNVCGGLQLVTVHAHNFCNCQHLSNLLLVQQLAVAAVPCVFNYELIYKVILRLTQT